jgi:anaerobic selenocysteine-containing dehydrogenase
MSPSRLSWFVALLALSLAAPLQAQSASEHAMHGPRRVTPALQPAGADRELAAPASRYTPGAERLSARKHIGWGAVLGAAAGVLTGLAVVTTCGELCHSNAVAGMALHVGLGTLAGAGAGALVYEIRR